MPSLKVKRNFSKRVAASTAERGLGLQGKATAQVMDFFRNAAARTGYGTPNLAEGTEYPIVRFTYDYWSLIALFETNWLARRIVELPCQTMVKAWPRLTSDIDPKQITKMDRALRRTNSKAKILTALTWAKLFGGAGCLIAVKDQENELDQPLDLDSVPLGGFAGLIPFDRWSGIYPSTDVCTDISRPLDFGLPESYTVRSVGGDSYEVHSSRILRFMGPAVPTPEKEAYSGWGISVIEPVLDDIKKYDNLSFNILALSFRANILGMKFPELAQLLSGLGSSQMASRKFEERMSAINHMISNQSLVPLPPDGGIEATSYSFAGLSEVYQQFQLAVSGAAQIPVSRFWGKTISGLGNGTNEGDEKVFEERIANDQDTDMRPQLDKLYPVIAMSEIGEVPDDMDLAFPSIRVLDEKEKSELAKTTVDSVTVCINTGIFSPRTGAKEIKQSSDITGFGTNLTDAAIGKLSDDVQSEGELGEGLFGGEGGKTLDPAGSPEAALQETDKLSGKGEGDEPDPKKPDGKQQVERQEATAQAKDGERLTPELVWLEACDNEALTVPRSIRSTEEGQAKIRANALRNLSFYAEQFHVPYEKCLAYVRSRGKAWDTAKDVVMRAFDKDGPGVKEFTIHGLHVVVETPKGRYREGKGFRQKMPAHYGYIRGHEGADGDSLDMYLGPAPESNWVYVVDQRHLPPRRGFDEHKVVLGADGIDQAVKIYNAGHDRAAEIYMDVTPMQIDDFKEWLRKADLRKPAGGVRP
jgi:phage-related protein (TIGR01555 family)